MIPRWSPYYPPGYVPCAPCDTTPWVTPTVAQFQAQFFRDWVYAPAQVDAQPPTPEGLRKYIFSLDITNAIQQAAGDFNPQYGPNNNICFLYLAAHYMVKNLRNSGMGLNSQAKFPLEASSVGGVSITNRITDKLIDDPNYAKYLTTGYGAIYLEMTYPYTVGAGIGIVPGQQTYA